MTKTVSKRPVTNREILSVTALIDIPLDLRHLSDADANKARRQIKENILHLLKEECRTFTYYVNYNGETVEETSGKTKIRYEFR